MPPNAAYQQDGAAAIPDQEPAPGYGGYGYPDAQVYGGPSSYGPRGTGGTMQTTVWDIVGRTLWAIRRRAWLVVVFFAVAMGIAVIWLNNTPTIYRAVGKLIVAPRIANPTGGEAYSDSDARFYATQTEILRGVLVNERVQKRLSEFRDSLGRLPGQNLTANIPVQSSIFTVLVDSENANYAKAYIDTLFDEFIKFKGEQKTGIQGTALDSYTREIGEKAEELRRAEDELLEFQRANPNVYVEGSSMAQQKQMTELSNRIVELRTQAELLKKLRDFFYKSRNAANAIDSFRVSGEEAPPLDDPSIRDMPWVEARRKLEELQTQYDTLALKYKPKHPIMKAQEDAITVAQKNLDRESETAEKDFKQRMEELELQIGVYEKQMQGLTQVNLQSVEKLTHYQKLLNNVDRTKKLYDQLVSGLATITTSVDTTQINIQIHEPALVIPTPISPNRPRTLIMAGLFGLGAGCGVVVLIDRLLNKVSTPEQVQNDLGLDLLGVIPRVTIHPRHPKERLFSAHPDKGGFAESFRTLRALIVQRSATAPTQVIQITSPQPGEGKSFISGNLAVVLAQGGTGVLLVSADLRRGDVHRAFEIPREPGLAEVLQGRATWQTMLHATGHENLAFISSGAPPQDAAKLLQSSLMMDLVAEWRRHFGVIIVDCPPLVAVSDAIILAPLCDATLLVLRSDSTPVRTAFTALDIMAKRARPPMGAVLNAIDLRRGYYPSYGYYRYHNADYSYGGGVRRRRRPDEKRPAAQTATNARLTK